MSRKTCLLTIACLAALAAPLAAQALLGADGAVGHLLHPGLQHLELELARGRPGRRIAVDLAAQIESGKAQDRKLGEDAGAQQPVLNLGWRRHGWAAAGAGAEAVVWAGGG